MSSLKTILQDFTASQGGGDGMYVTPLHRVIVMRTSKGVLPQHAQPILYAPALCIVAQGAKQITVGSDIFDYAERTALVVSVELPAVGRVTQATPETPYLGITIEFDVALMHEVLEQLETAPTLRPEERRGVFVERLSHQAYDCITRIAALLNTPDAIPVLYPTAVRELYYWLLTGPNGAEIAKIARRDSHTRRIADAICFLKKNLTRQVRVEEMAHAARMSPSSFHQHFKTITALTPLQFQKELRLLEARRLMVAQSATVTSAAYQVGYESLSQFSREYKRMFGASPKRDSAAMRQHIVATKAPTF